MSEAIRFAIEKRQKLKQELVLQQEDFLINTVRTVIYGLQVYTSYRSKKWLFTIIKILHRLMRSIDQSGDII